MNEAHSDALVFLGATGDLAYKKIFPSLQAMLRAIRKELGEAGCPRGARVVVEKPFGRELVSAQAWQNPVVAR